MRSTFCYHFFFNYSLDSTQFKRKRSQKHNDATVFTAVACWVLFSGGANGLKPFRRPYIVGKFFQGGLGHAPSGNFNFWSLKCHFLDFRGAFDRNLIVRKWHYNVSKFVIWLEFNICSCSIYIRLNTIYQIENIYKTWTCKTWTCGQDSFYSLSVNNLDKLISLRL